MNIYTLVEKAVVDKITLSVATTIGLDFYN